MIAELLFIVDLLQRKGLHQTESKYSGWKGFSRDRTQTPSVVTVASPVQYDLTMPVDISGYTMDQATQDYIAVKKTTKEESIGAKLRGGRL